MKPKLDGSHRDDVREWLGQPKPTPKCCYTCDFYNNSNGYCSEHADTPPDDFKEIGCEKWLENIPF